MKPLDPDLESLPGEWIEKAEADLEAAEQLAPKVAQSARLREVVGFHCRQTVEKYLKVLLTFYQIEFPKTHELERSLTLIRATNREVADALAETKWLGRSLSMSVIPVTQPKCSWGDEVRAIRLTRLAQRVVRRVLDE